MSFACQKATKCFDNWQHVKRKAKTTPSLVHKRHDHLPPQRHLHLRGPGAHPGDTAGSHCKQTGYSLCAHVAHKLKAQKKENFFRLETPGFFCISFFPPFNTPPSPFSHHPFSPSCSLHSAKVDNKKVYQHCFMCSSTSCVKKMQQI